MKKLLVITLVCLLVSVFESPVKTGTLTGIYTILHRGADIALPVGFSVFASAGGTVTETGFGQTKGKYVVISHGFGFDSRYLHLETIEVTAGEKVKKGNLIAKSGNTGKSTGPHLHFEICFFNIPLPPFLFCLPNMTIHFVLRLYSRHIKPLFSFN